jgi:hypothetical protein
MDLSRFLAVVGGALEGVGDSAISDSAIIDKWLSVDDIGAISAIKEHVDSSPVADLDRLDSTLLTMSATHFDLAVRIRLVKFYAMFKIVELLRYEKFRGFPD